MLLGPIASVFKVIIRQQGFRVILNADREKNVVKAFLKAFVKGVFAEQPVKNRVDRGHSFIVDGLAFLNRR